MRLENNICVYSYLYICNTRFSLFEYCINAYCILTLNNFKTFVGVCDHMGSFIDVFIGMPGRMHDARVFRMSPLFHAINEGRPLIPRHQHLIGDSAYPLLCNIMTPFRDNGHLTRSQSMYNVKLSSIRSIIERSFGLLKTKFRRLKYLDIADFDLGIEMIAATCCLHNFIIKRGELNVHDEDYLADEIDMQIQPNNIAHEAIVPAEAIEKRRQIVEQF